MLNEAHENRVTMLKQQIQSLTVDLKAARKQHGDEEAALVGKYEIAEKGYKDTLETYD